MTSMTAGTATEPRAEATERARVRAVVAEVLPDRVDILDMFDRATRTLEETAALKKWKADLIASMPVADPDEARRMIFTVADPDDAREILAALVPTIPRPTDVPMPKWATAAHEWTWLGIDNFWQRMVVYELAIPDVMITGFQEVHEDGAVELTGVELDLRGVDSIDDGGTTREYAQALHDAADILDAANGEARQRRGPAPSSQALIAVAIREVLTDRPIGQNELAIAAGYGEGDLSALMTGKTLMDLTDVERLAKGLDLDPFELMNFASDLAKDYEAGR